MLTALLRQRFGDVAGLEAVSRRLEQWPEDAALAAIGTAVTLDDVPEDVPT